MTSRRLLFWALEAHYQTAFLSTQRGRDPVANCLRGAAKGVVVKVRVSLRSRGLSVTQESADYWQTKPAASAETCISVTQIVKADALQSGASRYRRP